MSSKVSLKAAGLFTQPNNLELPEGALSEASNVIIQRADLIEPRRGFKLFGTSFGTITDRLKQLFVYKGRILRQYQDVLEFDTGTQTNAGEELFEAFSGSYKEAQEGLRTKSVESNGNFYFTSSEGIKKISASSAGDLTIDAGYITQAGGIKALDVTASLNVTQGNETGFLPQDSAVAYRIVWATKDLNGNLILGSPSQRAEVYNYLINLLLKDYNYTLKAIQNTANQPSPNNSIISDSDYVSALALPTNASPQQLQGKLIALASKLDNNLLLANDAGGPPLTISQINITNNPPNNVCTVTFTGGDPSDYFIIGSQVYLTGFPNGESGSLNGAQTISAVSSTTISFLTAAQGNTRTFVPSNVDTTGNIITVNSNNYVNQDPIQFTSTGALPAPLVAGTTYYIGSVTTDTFQVYSDQALTSIVVLTDQGTGTHTVSYFMPITATSINSNEFRSLAQPPVPGNPTPDQDLVNLQIYLTAIIQVLQNFLPTGTPPIISSYSQTTFIAGLSLTTTANVDLSITIPEDVTSHYFYQVYRSSITQATGVASLTDLTPSDEMQLVYEAFPTDAELAAGIIHITDITPDSFAGANLYTNPNSGEGLANANDVPPFALDINRFKNVVFYANTRTKYRESISLLGVSKMIDDYNNNIIPQLVISNGDETNTYSFVVGVNQITSVTTVADVSDSLNGTYFLLNSANDDTQYYIWYKTSGGTETDPALPGKVGIEVYINTNDSNATVAAKTADALFTAETQDFNTSVTTNVITITNANSGYTTNAAAGTSGFSVTTSTTGKGQLIARQSATFTAVADVSNNLAGKYFTFNTAFNRGEYYLWYRVSGSGTDPLVANRVGIPIDIATNDTAATVALKTATALNAFLPISFVATNNSTQFTISSYSYGPANTAAVGTSGFTLNSILTGALQVLLSNQVSPAKAVDETARSLVQIINQNSSESIYAFYLSGAGGIPGEMFFESRGLNTPQYYLLANNSNTGSSFNPDLSPKINLVSITAGDALTNLVTTVSAHGLNNGNQVVLSNTGTVPSVDGLYNIIYVSPTSFRISTTIYTGSSGQGAMISAFDGVAGSNEVRINRIYYSKLQEPESVPLANTIDVGAADKAILRIVPIRDSLFVFKEDGLYRISGEVSPFNLALFDSSCIVTAPDSVSIAKNLIYAWTTQGIVNLDESGLSNPPISRPIDVNILQLTAANYPNFITSTWGIGYESDNSYIVYTTNNQTDTEATIAYRYSTLTGTWTTVDKTNTCGIVNYVDDKLYLGAGDVNFLEQERKTFTRLDYADRELTSSITTGSYAGGNIIKLPFVDGITEGDVVVQDQDLTIYEYNTLLQKLDNDPGFATFGVSSITTGQLPTITTSVNHSFSTGDYVTLNNTQTTPSLDGTFKVTVTGANSFTVLPGFIIFTGNNTGTVKYSYYTNLKLSAGVDLLNGLTNLVNRFNDEPNLVYKSSSVSITSNSIANPTIITTSANHNLGPTGTVRQIKIAGNTGSTPSINGNHRATVTSPTTFSIPINVTAGGTGGSIVTLDDYISIIQSLSGSITNISVSNPTIITAPNHGMISDRYVHITGSNSLPTIDGNYTITLIDDNTFSLPINVTLQGTSGNFITLNDTFQDILSEYNKIISTLNLDPGTAFKNYKQSSYDVIQEAIVTSVNKFTKQITINQPLDYVVGPITIFKSIPTSLTYAPITLQDALNIKHLNEATMMFENKAFTEATLSFASDLLPKYIPITFQGNGNGIFGIGTGPFGGQFFGGGANAAPFRTYIPRDCQRCRYLTVNFKHSIAREKYSITGLTVTGNIQLSSRAYR